MSGQVAEPKHNIPLGTLVEVIEEDSNFTGIRLFVHKYLFNEFGCEGPTYALHVTNDPQMSEFFAPIVCGFQESGLEVIRPKSEAEILRAAFPLVADPDRLEEAAKIAGVPEVAASLVKSIREEMKRRTN